MLTVCHPRETWAQAEEHAGSEAQARPAPQSGRYESVDFDGGTLLVSRGHCESVDLDELVEWADKAYADAHGAWPDIDLPVRNLYVTGRNIQDYGLYKRKLHRVEYRCGWEKVIRHELFHHWCYEHALPCNCRLIDHPPEKGGVTLAQCAP